LTGDPFNVAIAENRKIDIYVNRQNGVHSDKSNYLSLLCTEYNVKPEEIAFAGDDIFDVGLMRLVGKSYCPSDAPEYVKQHAIVLSAGGENFVMRMFDHMEVTGQFPVFNFDDHLKKVYELDLQEKF
jgi:3-deoxy-D-manno-octulosonate 8-phosphate phosphatase (KDO 8-P phosphatase)